MLYYIATFFAGYGLGSLTARLLLRSKIAESKSRFDYQKELRRMSLEDRVTTRSSIDNEGRSRITQSKMSKRPGRNFYE